MGFEPRLPWDPDGLRRTRAPFLLSLFGGPHGDSKMAHRNRYQSGFDRPASDSTDSALGVAETS